MLIAVEVKTLAPGATLVLTGALGTLNHEPEQPGTSGTAVRTLFTCTGELPWLVTRSVSGWAGPPGNNGAVAVPPQCQGSRMQIPTSHGLEWKQIVVCPQD